MGNTIKNNKKVAWKPDVALIKVSTLIKGELKQEITVHSTQIKLFNNKVIQHERYNLKINHRVM